MWITAPLRHTHLLRLVIDANSPFRTYTFDRSPSRRVYPLLAKLSKPTYYCILIIVTTLLYSYVVPLNHPQYLLRFLAVLICSIKLQFDTTYKYSEKTK